MGTTAKAKTRSGDLHKELANQNKRDELLKGIFDHQIVALGFDDVQSLLADDGIVIRSIGGGDTCRRQLTMLCQPPSFKAAMYSRPTSS